jgi:alkylhydroperoxidase/carboxymuconolactone decarboxylase family protein YurZ
MKKDLGEAAGSAADLNAVFSGSQVAARLQQVAPTLHEAVSAFWQSANGPGALSPRMKQLVLVAMHSTVTALNAEGTRRHVRRALEAGATPLDVLDVLVTIAPTANHALYFALPVLMRELKAAGRSDEFPEPTPEVQAIKDEFIRTRGVWLAQREAIFRLMPQYYAALSKLSTASWKDGSLTRKERELIALSVDCIVNHMFEPGLAMHVRCAIEHGASRDEILDVFQLASLLGLETYIQGAEALFGEGGAGD